MQNIVRASNRDIQDVFALLREVNLPVEGVADHFHNFFVAREDGRLVGCAGIEIYHNVGLMRSVAVHNPFQGRGLGRQLVERIHDFAIENGLKRIYLITETAEKFFLMQNYVVIPRDNVDREIRQSAEFTHLCAASAICMVRFLE